jgi:hypothetical protein
MREKRKNYHDIAEYDYGKSFHTESLFIHVLFLYKLQKKIIFTKRDKGAIHGE